MHEMNSLTAPFFSRIESEKFLNLVNSTGGVRREKLGRFHRRIVAENTMMTRVSEAVGFHLHFSCSANAWLAEMNL